jgi:hypothetical protein
MVKFTLLMGYKVQMVCNIKATSDKKEIKWVRCTIVRQPISFLIRVTVGKYSSRDMI